MGVFRLILSVMVVLSHLAIYAGTLNPGVIAVCGFFILSGYVMTALCDKHYPDPARFGLFIADRAMRLYPQYLLYMGLTGVLILVAHPPSGYLSNLSPQMILLNLAMIPIGYSALFSSLSSALIIPPAATLGLEFTFYLIFPFLLYHRQRIAALLLSFAVFVLAYFNVIATDTWGYRLLPGTLFIFMMGSVLRRGNQREQRVSAALYAASAALLLWTVFTPSLRAPFNREMLIGIVAGMPLVWWLARLRESRFDVLAGNLSYGVFLNHFLLILTWQSFWRDPVSPGPGLLLLFLVSSVVLAGVSYVLVERPVIRYRHRMRKRLAGR